jgi:hypothetical protein
MSSPDDTLPLPPHTGPGRPDPLDLVAPAPLFDDTPGRFTAGATLGSGGQADVHAVHDHLLDRPLAAKRTRGTAAGPRHLLEEARVMGAIAHPGVLPVHDFGVTRDREAWLLMERIEGVDLKAWIADRGPVAAHDGSLLRVLDALATVCDTLSLAHDRGWLHRDVKPSNVMLGSYGRVVLIDWGLALPQARWHTPGSAVGTPGYLAPEQAHGEPLGPQTDVFGVGACLFAALTGRRPRPGSRSDAFEAALARAPVTVPDDLLAPPVLLDLLRDCLAPDPTDRPPSAARVRDALDRARRGVWHLPSRAVQPGDIVVAEGDTGDSAYVIVSGRFEVRRAGRGVLRVLGPGDVFGELAPIMRADRTATVVALEPGELAIVDGAALREWLAVGHVAGRFVEALARRLRAVEGILQRGR